jgi:hypothetical protein
MSAKRYPPLFDWVELGWIAAAPVAGVCVDALVAGVDEVVSVGAVAVCCEVVGVVVVACELVVAAELVVPVVSVDVLVEVGVAVPVEVAVVVELVAAGGGGVPGVGGSVDALGPVTSAPFLAVIVTNA